MCLSARCTGDFAAAVVVVGPVVVVVVVGNTAEIAGTFHNWEPFGATVDSLNRVYSVEYRFEHKVVVG